MSRRAFWAHQVYAALVIDVDSRHVVGWQLATHLRTDLALDALEMAVRLRQRQKADLSVWSTTPTAARRWGVRWVGTGW